MKPFKDGNSLSIQGHRRHRTFQIQFESQFLHEVQPSVPKEHTSPTSEDLRIMKMNTVSLQVITQQLFLFQAGTGISANIFLLFLHIFTFLQDFRVKPTDVISCHLALVHMVMLLIALCIFSPDIFESQKLKIDYKCKALIFMHRVTRGISISTTCLLSVFQAITISPSTSWLVRFKHKFTNYVVYIVIIFWCWNLSIGTYFIFYTVVYSNKSQKNLMRINKHCSIASVNPIIKELFFVLTFFRDVFLVGLMLLSSAYMVILLFRHQRQSQHLHSTKLTSRVSPEQRATKTILLLVSFFVVMYWADTIIHSFSTLIWKYDPVLFSVQKLVLNIYATVCPIIQTTSHKIIKATVQNIKKICAIN
ncbi:vomeronasal type-1 receptor 90-like [Perognathus longimembris pacificus]|uniref:vomeronasal type-1 receptor 90-like n=1 Tax=Perognathus longimembris pacificus TaxID=214514 RepID=UPI002018BA42|nr:vomeronasal type-1 receptor 90-like [Perognathus longimembris pacificus]